MLFRSIRISGNITYFRGDGTTYGSFDLTSKNASQSVSTSPVNIATGSYGAIVFVSGNLGGVGQFADLVFFGYSGGIVVLASTTVVGSPASRTYTGSTYDLRVAMGSGTYDVASSILRHNQV